MLLTNDASARVATSIANGNDSAKRRDAFLARAGEGEAPAEPMNRQPAAQRELRPPCEPRRLLLASVFVTLSLSIGTAKAQPARPNQAPDSAVRIRSVSAQSRGRLASIRLLIKSRRYAQAVRLLRQCMTGNDANNLVATDFGNVQRHVPLRRACHWIAARWFAEAPEALRQLRRQLDGPAGRQLASAHNRQALLRFRELFWISSIGDDAQLRLAENALEAGHLQLARAQLLQLSPTFVTTARASKELGVAENQPWGRALIGIVAQDKKLTWKQVVKQLQTRPLSAARRYPDTDIPLSEIWGRLAMISILTGEQQRADIELNLLRLLFPNAEGRIGKQKGKLHALLTELSKKRLQWKQRQRSTNWPTFAGGNARSSHAASTIRIARRPIWTHPLPVKTSTSEHFSTSARRVAESRGALLSYHPIALNGRVYVHTSQDTRGVTCLDLDSGKVVWPKQRETAKTKSRPNNLKKPRQLAGVPRYTITASGHYLLARVGSPRTGTQTDETWPRSRNQIVVMDLRSEGRLLGDPIDPPGRDWAFEGAPLVQDGQLFIALRHRQQVRSALHVAAINLQTGRQIWRTQIASAESPKGGLVDEVTHSLLSLAEGKVYINSGLGAVACLESVNGNINWICTYPRQFERSSNLMSPRKHLFRDLSPCVVADGVVIAAPPDNGSIYCFDAFSGELRWQSDNSATPDAIHLLGIIGDRVVVSGNYLYWLDSRTGRLVSQFPARRATGVELAFDAPRGLGRGLLAADEVWWPTKDNIFVFRQKRLSSQSSHPRLVDKIPLAKMGVQSGNLLLANGILLVTGPSQIAAFNEYGRVIGVPKTSSTDR